MEKVQYECLRQITGAYCHSSADALDQGYSKFLKAGPYLFFHQPFEVRKTTIPSKKIQHK